MCFFFLLLIIGYFSGFYNKRFCRYLPEPVPVQTEDQYFCQYTPAGKYSNLHAGYKWRSQTKNISIALSEG